MASNDERTRQMITARRTQLRNQEKEQETPIRANPKAKSEPPFKFNTETMGVKDAEVKDDRDDENPETTHAPKGKRGRPSNIKKGQLKKKNPDHDTEKDTRRSRTHWRKAYRGYLVDQLSKHGWKWPKTAEGKKRKTFETRIGPNYDRLTWHLIN